MKRIEVHEHGSEEVLRLVDADPAEVGAGRIRLEIFAAGVNPADAYVRAGNYEFLKPDLPFTPGYDAAGVVNAVGSGVNGLRRGDRVWVSTIPARTLGTYTQTLVCDAALAHPLPDSLSFAEGAAIGVPYTTAFRALFQRGGAQSGESVLIHGASGGVGLPAVQLAAAAGLTVIGTAGTPAGLDLVRQNGAAHAVDHSQPGYLSRVAELTDGQGVDLVVEMRADRNLQEDMNVLASRGRIIIVGSRGSVSVSPRALMVSEADIRGMALWNMTPAEFQEAYTALDALLRSGTARPVVGKQFPLSEAAAAQRHVATARAEGKVVLLTR